VELSLHGKSSSKGFSAPLILGHRGASAIAPENTLAAFSQAISDGADGIEFDVRLSSDGVPVVIHDPTLNRTGLISGRVRELTSAQLKEIDVGTWFDKRSGAFTGEKLPTLEEVFDLFAGTSVALYVEMKCDADEGASLASAIVDQIHARNMKELVVVESFDLSAIREIKKIDPGARTAALFEPKFSKPVAAIRSQTIINLARTHGADEIALHHTLARKRILEEAQKEEFEIVVWTVDDPVWVDRARTYGIKALIANNPRPMVEFRDASQFQGGENSRR
jgi:glycerophosphoryl diester phosphodiesterase